MNLPTYTALDLVELRGILWSFQKSQDVERALKFQTEVIGPLRAILLEEQLTSDEVHKALKNWLTSQQTHFLFDVPLEDVPLYMDDNSLKYLVKWRFAIGK